MTLFEFADVAGCGHTTVYRVARSLYPGKIRNGRRTDFDETESVRIMEEVRKKGLVRPFQNAKLEKLKTVLNGLALRELVRIYGTKEAARRIDHLIGYSRLKNPDVRKALPVPETEGPYYFKQIRDRLHQVAEQKKQQELFTLN